ncbi:DUF5983 family protein [Paenibacillus terreus]|uniref:DUF5983 family protein n=1 Tax=Paenibacillus terreus TaxID=1387834 RepID=UPI0035CCD755
MMKHASGLTVTLWGQDKVKGHDADRQPFVVSARTDERLDRFFYWRGERMYAKEFLTVNTSARVVKMLDLSMGHVQSSTVDFLMLQMLLDNPSVVVYEKAEYGFILPVIGEISESMPDDLSLIYALAEEQGCDWIMLDRDGNISDALPFYEW